MDDATRIPQATRFPSARPAAAPAGRLPEISPAHARGLRRLLFREFHDHAVRHYPRLQRMLANARFPLRPGRECAAVAARTRAAIHAACHGVLDREPALLGLVLDPVRQERHGGSQEALRVQLVVLMRNAAGQPMPWTSDFARVGEHVAERLFQRLGTMEPADAREELITGLAWLAFLHLDLWLHGKAERLLRLAVPTPRGVLVAVRDPATGVFEIRTYLRRGQDHLLDGSSAVVQRWLGEGKGAHVADLLDVPENWWWSRPYQRGEARLARQSARRLAGSGAAVATGVAFSVPGC